MILGRNAGLWAGLMHAGVNVVMAAVVVISGHDLTAADIALFAAVNAFLAVSVGLIANASDPTTAPAFAWTTTPPGTPTPPPTTGSSGATASAPSTASGATDPTAGASGASGGTDPSAGVPPGTIGS